MQTTTPGATKRATVSTCPSVWSLIRPSPSQRTFSAPRPSPRRRSRAPCARPGLRFGFRRHWRVVRSVPSPSGSTEPPSRTSSSRNVAKARRRGDAHRDLGVARQVVLAAPAVEGERGGRDVARVGRHEDRRDVAHPDVAERDLVDAGAEAGEPRARLVRPRRRRRQDLELLAPGRAVRPGVGDGAREGDEGVLHRAERLLPELLVARPGEPARRVRRPLAGLREPRGEIPDSSRRSGGPGTRRSFTAIRGGSGCGRPPPRRRRRPRRGCRRTA